jgi:DNA-binding NarL/FixJ family response regulator
VIRVLVVGESARARAELASRLAGDHQLELVGQALRVADLARLVGAPNTDVVVAALDRSDERAAAALLALAAEGGGPAVVAIVDHADDADPVWASEALHAGVSAVLPRDAGPAELQAAVVAAAAGLVVMRREDLARGAGAAGAAGADATGASAVLGAATPREGAAAQRPPLTPREREVLGLLAEGFGNKAIAARLSVTERTVKFHVGAILEKLGVASRTEAVTAGLRRGLILL